MNKSTTNKPIYQSEFINPVDDTKVRVQPERVRILKEYVYPDIKRLLAHILLAMRRPLVSMQYCAMYALSVVNWKRTSVAKMGVLSLFVYALFFQGGSASSESVATTLSATHVDKQSMVPAFVSEIDNAEARSFIRTYGKLAIADMHTYQIPASIKMGQALIESRAGQSRLAQESNNHFGIKCRRKCRGCTCRNYKDDDIYDMFRVFESPDESWQEHSVLLSNTRYQHLKQHGMDYRKWARGLKKAGYATDNSYDKKLIGVIQRYKLYKLDEM